MAAEDCLPLLPNGHTEKRDSIRNHKDYVTTVIAYGNREKSSIANGNVEASQRHMKDTNLQTNSTGSFSLRRLSSKKQLTLLLLVFSNFAASMCFSLPAPFFPIEATAKDMSPTAIGLVISCYELCIFVSSPFFGKHISHFGAVFLFTMGQFVTGFCSLLFGFLNLSPPGVVFTVMCVLVRTVTALGASAFATASIAIIGTEYPAHVATVFGAVEVFVGLGYVSGPLFGGALYEAGGFGLPFWVMGGFLLACVVLTAVLLPVIPEPDRGERKGSILRLMSSPLALVALFSVTVSTYTFGNLEATLAIHTTQFEINAVVLGVLFMLASGLYSLASPLVGWLSDAKGITYPLLIVGNMTVGLSLLIMGPSPLLPFLSANLWLTVVGLVLMGPAQSACFLPTLQCFYTAAAHKGIEKGVDLDGLVSGVFTSAVHFGGFVGPLLGSAVLEVSGYGWCTTLNACLMFISGISISVYVISTKTCFRRHADDSRMTSEQVRQNVRSSYLEHSLTLSIKRAGNL